MIGRTIDTRYYGQTIFMARKARKCREVVGLFVMEKDELKRRKKCMRLRKIDMYKVMNQWTLTWMTDEAFKEKCG